MGARVLGRGAALPPAGRDGAVIASARGAGTRGVARRHDTLADCVPGRGARRARAHATGALRGCVRGAERADPPPRDGRKPISPSRDDPSIAVSVRAADCVPILLADRRTGAVAAIHAGWKGTAAGAAIVAVQSLTSRYGTNPRRRRSRPSVRASARAATRSVPISPAIFHRTQRRRHWFTRDAKPHLDLWRATRDQLARAGVPPQQIHVCELCTFDHPALFHSYRRDGKNAGRLVAAIRSAPGRTP